MDWECELRWRDQISQTPGRNSIILIQFLSIKFPFLSYVLMQFYKGISASALSVPLAQRALTLKVKSGIPYHSWKSSEVFKLFRWLVLDKYA